jgi:ABC-type transport system involved in multi-copper enzyme maturation permease subunit
MTTTTTTPVPGVERTRATVLPAVLRSEWTKLRSVRSTVWALLATVGITVGFGTLFCLAYAARYDRLALSERRTVEPTLLSLRGVFLSSLAIGVLGVLVITAEYATGMIRSTFAAVPQRRSVLAAKAIVFGVVATIVSFASAFAAFAIGQAILNRKHLGVSLSDPTVLRAVLGAGAYLTIVGLLGLALGAILRRTAGAIATLVALVFIADLLVQALPDPWNTDVGKFLPGNAGLALFSVRQDPGRLTPGSAFVVLLIWLAVTFAIAAVALTRRDA